MAMTKEQIRKKLKELEKTQVQMAYESGVSYQTLRGVLNDNALFETKANTLRKLEAYLKSKWCK